MHVCTCAPARSRIAATPEGLLNAAGLRFWDRISGHTTNPLRDEGAAYARKLKEAGVAVTALRFNGTIHDFVLLNGLRHVPTTEAALALTSEGIRDHLKP